MTKESILKRIFIVSIFIALAVANVFAQTTVFSYQGRLTELGSPVTGTRFFRFTLFDENGAAMPGAVIQQTLTVTAGVFNTSLDFGANAFPGADRSFEIAVKLNAGDPFTILNPRQSILSAPYSIKSKTSENSAQLGGVDAAQFVQTDAGGNVSLAGDLTVNGSLSMNTVNTQTQYNLGGQRVLGNAGNNNLFVGTGAGAVNAGSFNTFAGNLAGNANTTGDANSFFGNTAGFKNTIGTSNSFFGAGTGVNNVSGNNNAFFGSLSGFNNTANSNSFFGAFAGQSNTIGDRNSFFGYSAGQANTTGAGNSFIGESAGLLNSQGSFNSFVGESAGRSNTTGNQNTFVGNSAGRSNTTGIFNVFLGTNAGYSNTTGINNTFVGRNAGLNNNADKNTFFGNSAGQANTSGFSNAFFGESAGLVNVDGNGNSFFGKSSGIANVNGGGNSFFGYFSGGRNTDGTDNSFFGHRAGSNINGTGNSFVGGDSGNNSTVGNYNSFFGYRSGLNNLTGISNTLIGAFAEVATGNLTNATALGANAVVSQSNSVILGNNANVGIGTSTPQAKFNVVGSSWFQGDTTPLPNTAGKGIVIGFSGDQGYISGFDYTTFTPKNLLLNLGGGNVGIGTTAPTSRLTVTGLIETTTGGIKFPDGTIQKTAGGGNGILNQTTLQTGANFNIDGNGVASALFGNFIAANDYRNSSGDTSILNSIGGVLRVGLGAGIGAGGGQNTFVGNSSGDNSGTSDNNTFVGYQSGRLASGTTGGNSFFGAFTGGGTQGGFNSFFGVLSGAQTTTGSNNSFFGANAGQMNTGGQNNVFVGFQAGKTNLLGSENTFVGVNAGLTNPGDSRNTFIGAETDGNTAVTNATAIGNRAKVTADNSLVLGSINGVNGAAFSTNVGIGTTAPKARLEVADGNILIGSPGQGIILKSPDGGTCRLFSIDNAGAMVLTAIVCP